MTPEWEERFGPRAASLRGLFGPEFDQALAGGELYAACATQAAGQAVELHLFRHRDQVLVVAERPPRRRSQTRGLVLRRVSHDLNNALHVARQAAEAWQPEPDSEDALLADDLRTALEQALLLSDLLRALGRTQAAEPAVVDLAAAVLDLSATLDQRLPAGTELTCDDIPTEALVWGDEPQLALALRLLGELALSAPGPCLTLACRPTLTGRFALALTGCPRLRRLATSGGTSLGHGPLELEEAVLRQVVAAQEVTVTALPEGVSLTWPSPPAAAPGPGAVAGAAPAPPSHILIVEDEPLIASYVRRSLERLGHTCEWAPDGQAALDRLRQPAPAVDLLVLDVYMPRLRGDELVEALAAEERLPAVVVTTAYADPALLRAMASRGCHHVLSKPFSDDDLRLAVDRALAQRS